MATPQGRRRATTKGFARTNTLVRGHVRDASAQRGFAQARLLTEWEETVGTEIASISRPVEVTYAKGGFGATLILLTTGANAPILEMQKDAIRTRVNSVYGYSAIARIRITQTARSGFAEGQVEFRPKTAASTKPEPSDADKAAARELVAPVADDGLRAALARLGAHINSKS